jgi:hypothetical protein
VKFINLAALLLMAGSLWLIIEITIERWWIAIITFASIFLNIVRRFSFSFYRNLHTICDATRHTNFGSGGTLALKESRFAP